MAEGWKAAIGGAWGKLSGRDRRERAARAAQILAEHEARDHFGADEALSRLQEFMSEQDAVRVFSDHAGSRISQVVQAALDDGVLDPQEDARIADVIARYGEPRIDDESRQLMHRARQQYHAMTAPLEPVETTLLLRRGEYAVYGQLAEAVELRQRTVRVNYSGPSARVRIMKGVYYSVGSMNVGRETQEFMHSFGDGVLVATNKRLLWVSPQKTISVALGKIVSFEPYSDGIRVHKDTGKPLGFRWPGDDGIAAVWIGRAIEELRD